ncbi:MAG: hypothetical protein LBT83_03840 [Tannerella sp.]|jgi:hypothetical protein|nr:hypothetical protein [Tannerella sp.]
MKINFFLLFISIAMCGLIFFGFYKWDDDLWLSILSASISLIFLVTTLAMEFPDAPRSGTMVKVTSGIFFFVFLVLNILFSVFNASETSYVLTNGIGLCIWASSVYGIAKTKQ